MPVGYYSECDQCREIVKEVRPYGWLELTIRDMAPPKDHTKHFCSGRCLCDWLISLGEERKILPES